MDQVRAHSSWEDGSVVDFFNRWHEQMLKNVSKMLRVITEMLREIGWGANWHDNKTAWHNEPFGDDEVNRKQNFAQIGEGNNRRELYTNP